MATRSTCPPNHAVIHSLKQWPRRPRIWPRIIVLHSTESAANTGRAVSGYLARPATQADVHLVIDTNGDKYRLVPNRRKAWHVAFFNRVALGIEQIGRASQTSWDDRLLTTVAKQLACWSYHYNIPLRDVRRWKGARKGVLTHASLGFQGGGHHDPGAAYPFKAVLARARHIKRETYGSVKAHS